MNTNEYLVPSCGSFTSPEIPCIDATSINSSGSLYMTEHLQSPEYVNYYDSQIDILEQMKKELPEDDKELELIEKEIKLENTNGNILLGVNEKDQKLDYEINIKTERQEQTGVLDNEEYVNEYSDVTVDLRAIEYKFVKKKIEIRLNKAPKTSAERGREFRARKALLKEQIKQHQDPGAIVEMATEDIRSAGSSEVNQVPGPSEIRTIEKRAKSAEATRRWRERKRGVSESSKKQAKTAAQRMREYRKRKKL